MRLVKYESYIVTVKSASCLPAGDYLLYFQNVFVFEETCSCGLAILNFSESLMIQVYSSIFMLMMR